MIFRPAFCDFRQKCPASAERNLPAAVIFQFHRKWEQTTFHTQKSGLELVLRIATKQSSGRAEFLSWRRDQSGGTSDYHAILTSASVCERVTNLNVIADQVFNNESTSPVG